MSNQFNHCEEFEEIHESKLMEQMDEDHLMIYHNLSSTPRSDTRLPTSMYRSSSFSTHPSTPQLISSFSTATPSSPHTPKRMVHFLEDPSPIDDDALDITILGILSSEDRYGILSPLSRLLEKPLKFSQRSNHNQSNTRFEVELNRRLRQLSNSTFRHKRWSSTSDFQLEESLLELISDRLELKDSDSNSKGNSSPKESTSQDLLTNSQDHPNQEQLQKSWFTKAGGWVFDTLTFVPWYSISSL